LIWLKAAGRFCEAEHIPGNFPAILCKHCCEDRSAGIDFVPNEKGKLIER
jgi:hypothetical protein